MLSAYLPLLLRQGGVAFNDDPRSLSALHSRRVVADRLLRPGSKQLRMQILTPCCLPSANKHFT